MQKAIKERKKNEMMSFLSPSFISVLFGVMLLTATTLNYFVPTVSNNVTMLTTTISGIICAISHYWMKRRGNIK